MSNNASEIFARYKRQIAKLKFSISDEEKTMSQENNDHESKRKTDSKTCMPDVEEISCETCFELKGNRTGDYWQTLEHISNVFIS